MRDERVPDAVRRRGLGGLAGASEQPLSGGSAPVLDFEAFFQRTSGLALSAAPGTTNRTTTSFNARS